MQDKRLYSAKQFADRIGVHKNTVLNWQKRGILPDRRSDINGYRVFTEDDVQLVLSKIRSKKPDEDMPGGW